MSFEHVGESKELVRSGNGESGNIFTNYVVNFMKAGHVNHDSKQVIADDKLSLGGIVSRRSLAPHEKLVAWRPLFTTFLAAWRVACSTAGSPRN
jgi:hypothetical protein